MDKVHFVSQATAAGDGGQLLRESFVFSGA
jgi:hypothetical protein